MTKLNVLVFGSGNLIKSDLIGLNKPYLEFMFQMQTKRTAVIREYLALDWNEGICFHISYGFKFFEST
jgi:hypothetical protein